MSSRRLATFLFDLDGTLIDSIELIRLSFEHALREHGKPPMTRERWLCGLGTPLAAQFAAVAADAREVDAMIATYRAFNGVHHDRLVVPYPGVDDMLLALRARGAQLGIVTSKLHASARRGLARCGLASFFEVIVGLDDVAIHKPRPEPVLAALERLSCEPSGAIFVGDSPHDLAAGRAAGVRTGAALWGPFERSALAVESPDHWLATPGEVLELG